MPKAIIAYVRTIDRINRLFGLIAMYLVFVMIIVLLYSSFMKTFFVQPLWYLEIAQFLMVSYFLLGGGYSMQTHSHVRMDLLYSRWSPRTKAIADLFTILMLVFYLVFLLYGAVSSTQYALQYGETSNSAWRPKMAPIKIIMTFGIAMMLLQALATFFKDLARARGVDDLTWTGEEPPR